MSYVVVALAWLTATLIAPANDQPYAIGSTNGSAWNAAFIFNGKDRLAGKSPEPQGTVYEPGHVYPTATQSERDHIPILPPSATRLLTTVGPLSGQRLGMEVLVALLLGLPALLLGLRAGDADPAPQARSGGDRSAVGARPAPTARLSPRVRPPGHGPPVRSPGGGATAAPAPVGPRMRRAAAGGLIVWMATGIFLFSDMARLHPRYVEGFVPVVAAMLGIGLAWAVAARGRLRLGALVLVMLVVVYYAEHLLYGHPATWWVVLAGALGAVAAGILAQRHGDTAATPLLVGRAWPWRSWRSSPWVSKPMPQRSPTRSAMRASWDSCPAKSSGL